MATKDNPHSDPAAPAAAPVPGSHPLATPQVSRGHVVEFTDMRGHAWPAIVLNVKDDGATIDAMLLTNRGATPDFDIPQSEAPAGKEKARGRWSWPPRS